MRGSGAVGSVIIQQPAAAPPNLSRGKKLIDIRFTLCVTLDNLTLDGSVRVEEGGPEATSVDAGGVDGTTTITGHRVGTQFGDPNDTRGVQGANGGPVALGIVAFNDNRYRVGTDEYATNVIV